MYEGIMKKHLISVSLISIALLVSCNKSPEPPVKSSSEKSTPQVSEKKNPATKASPEQPTLRVIEKINPEKKKACITIYDEEGESQNLAYSGTVAKLLDGIYQQIQATKSEWLPPTTNGQEIKVFAQGTWINLSFKPFEGYSDYSCLYKLYNPEQKEQPLSSIEKQQVANMHYSFAIVAVQLAEMEEVTFK